MVAHYTSVEGFKSIIENDKLRMTRSEFMNDPSDSQMLGKMICNYLGKSKKEKRFLDENTEKIYQNATVADYIDFIHKTIHLYVLSFTKKADEMEFWNYYGNGGVQLEIDENKLLTAFAEKLKGEEEYIACAPVIYTSEKQELKDIQLNSPLAEFELRGKENKSIFKEHMNKLDPKNKQLYETDNIQRFVDSFVKDYCTSLKYLKNKNEISELDSPDKIMKLVFENQIKAIDTIIFKKDFLIYMILLSALIKTDSYEYENEIRIVYFENSISTKKRKYDEYELKSNFEQKYIRPYVEFEKMKLQDSLNSIIISPLARNIPIDSQVYKEVISQFMEKNHYKNIDINISKHKCRW